MICRRCGTELRSCDRFCPICGTPIDTPKRNTGGETAEYRAARKARTPALVTAAQDGDENAFSELYRLYYQKVFALAKTTVKTDADAEDVLQLTFIKAWNGICKLNKPEAFSTWIQRITLNQCYALLRSRHIDIPIDETEDEESFGSIRLESDLMLPEVYAERSDLRARLARIISELSAVQKQAITLYYHDGLPVENIAWIMSCSVNTVKSRLFLARRSIRTEIEEQERKSGQPFFGIVGLATIPFGKLFVEYVGAMSLPKAAAAGTLRAIAQHISETGANNVQTAQTVAASAAKQGSKAAAKFSAKAGAITAVKSAANAVSKKVIAGVIAGVLTVGAITGGTVAAVSIANKNHDADVETIGTVPSASVLPGEAAELSYDDGNNYDDDDTNESESINGNEYAAVQKPNLVATYSFVLEGTFCNGLAWVDYKDEFDTWWLAAINEEFKIVYQAQEGTYAGDFLDDGFSYYTSKQGDVIVDTMGRDHFITKKEEEESVSICGHGDGAFILRKEINTLYQKGIYLSVVDSEGNIIFGEQEIEDNISTNFKYYGEGIFRCYDPNRRDGCFFNTNTGAFIREYAYSDQFITSFEDGKAYYEPYYPKTMIVTPDMFESESVYFAWRSKLSGRDRVDRYKPELTFPDPITITGYGNESGGYYPVQLKGADGKAYFTMVDGNGVQQYEPFQYPELTFVSFTGDSSVESKLDDLFENGILTYLDGKDWYVVFQDGRKSRIGEINYVNSLFGFDGTYLYLCNSVYHDADCRIVNVFTGKVMDEIYLYDDVSRGR